MSVSGRERRSSLPACLVVLALAVAHAALATGSTLAGAEDAEPRSSLVDHWESIVVVLVILLVALVIKMLKYGMPPFDTIAEAYRRDPSRRGLLGRILARSDHVIVAPEQEPSVAFGYFLEPLAYERALFGRNRLASFLAGRGYLVNTSIDVPASTNDPLFLASARESIDVHGEVLAMIRLPQAGGERAYEIFEDCESLEARVRSLPPRTSVTLLEGSQLPLRGFVDETLVARAEAMIPCGAAYVVATLDPAANGSGRPIPSLVDVDRGRMLERLRDETARRRVAVGLEPIVPIAYAFVPDADGSIHPADHGSSDIA